MRIANLIYADDLQSAQNPVNTKNQQMIVFNPFTVIVAPFIPTTYSFSIMINFIDLSTGEDNFQVTFVNRTKNEVLLSTEPTPIDRAMVVKGIPLEHLGFAYNMNLRNVVLSAEGDYCTIVKYGDKTEEFPLSVVVRQPE